MASSLALVTYFVRAMQMNRKPTYGLFLDGLMAYDGLLQQFDEVQKSVMLATPEIVVHKFKQGVQLLGNPPGLANHVVVIEGSCLSTNGRAWLQGLKDAIKKYHAERAAKEAAAAKGATAQTTTTATEGAAEAVSGESTKSQDSNHKDIFPS